MATGGADGWLLLCSAGVLAGFCSGLLGIGGGSVVVPALIIGLPMIGVAGPEVAKIAMATSLAMVIPTSIAATQAHAQRGTLNWELWAAMAPSIVLGGVVISMLVQHISASLVLIIYIAFALFSAWRQAAKALKVESKQAELVELTWPRLGLISVQGIVGGALAALVGVGVGFVAVPALRRFAPIAHAIGTASALAIPMAAISSIGYLFAPAPAGCGDCYGYVHPVAVCVVGVGSVLAAPLGAACTTRLPTRQLGLLFALFLGGGAISLLVKKLPELSAEAHARVAAPLIAAWSAHGGPAAAPIWLGDQMSAPLQASLSINARHGYLPLVPKQPTANSLDGKLLAFARLSLPSRSAANVPLPERRPARASHAPTPPPGSRAAKPKRAPERTAEPAPQADPPTAVTSTAPDLLKTLYGRP